jgi:hypothetical protein
MVSYDKWPHALCPQPPGTSQLASGDMRHSALMGLLIAN